MSTESYKNNYFIYTLLIIAGIKIILATIVPITGDEAYYTIWGQYPALGYYDHPPFIGWLLHAVLYLGQSELIVRLPTIITTLAISIGIYLLLKPYETQKAALIAILYLISPISICDVIITTDTPLMLFGFFSGACLFLAIKHHDNLFYYFLAGVFLGLAFLSKYFAVLLALAYLFYFLFSAKSLKRCLGFFILFLCILPFGLENLYWNYTHAWSNILFNVFNRNENAAFSWASIFTYLIFIFYLITPPIFYYLIKYRGLLLSKNPHGEFNILPFFFIIPLSFFLLLSSIKSIGLHWPLSFIPFIYLALFSYLNHQELKRCIKFTFYFSALHLILIAVVTLTSITTWQKLNLSDKKYADIIFLFKHKEISQYLNQYNNNYIITSPTYSKADIIHFDGNNYCPTFGRGSVHGRQDDFITDFKEFNHKNFIIFYTMPPTADNYKTYFANTELKKLVFYNANFYIVLAHDFNYETYRNTILRDINNRYWQIPNFLPHTASFYCEKYFQNEGCPSL